MEYMDVLEIGSISDFRWKREEQFFYYSPGHTKRS